MEIAVSMNMIGCAISDLPQDSPLTSSRWSAAHLATALELKKGSVIINISRMDLAMGQQVPRLLGGMKF